MMIWTEEHERALREGRLAWKCTDPYGRPCNGGSKDHRLQLAPDGGPGEWLPERERRTCSSGYHVTGQPHRWAGQCVWLVESREPVAFDVEKTCVSSIRALAQVDPDRCVDETIWVAANRANLRGAYLGGANLGGAYLRGAYLDGANLDGAYLGGAYLRGANLDGANLRGANLDCANLDCANLDGANLGGAYLGGANLGGAYLRGAYLGGANLGGAYLRGAYLGGAYLRGANLGGANLGGAYLRGANLDGAYLRGANLDGANLDGVINADKALNPPPELLAYIERCGVRE